LPYLEALVALEISKRPENGNRARITAAKFPTLKTLESFDFSLQSELPKTKLIEHFDGTFVGEHRNVIFTGPPGVGKSHLLSALGLAL
jgi:DNA replication protein DnaC